MRKTIEKITTIKEEQICCDRCGKNIELDWETVFPNVRKQSRTRVLHEERCYSPWYDNETSAWRVSRDPKNKDDNCYDLCKNCYEEFIKWIDKGEK